MREHDYQHFTQACDIEICNDKTHPKLQEDDTRNRIWSSHLTREECNS